jgi:hypothetical protein
MSNLELRAEHSFRAVITWVVFIRLRLGKRVADANAVVKRRAETGKDKTQRVAVRLNRLLGRVRAEIIFPMLLLVPLHPFNDLPIKESRLLKHRIVTALLEQVVRQVRERIFVTVPTRDKARGSHSAPRPGRPASSGAAFFANIIVSEQTKDVRHEIHILGRCLPTSMKNHRRGHISSVRRSRRTPASTPALMAPSLNLHP